MYIKYSYYDGDVFESEIKIFIKGNSDEYIIDVDFHNKLIIVV